jgi:hypothetical protein
MAICNSLKRAGAVGLIAAGAFTLALPASGQDSKPRYTAEDIQKAKPSASIEVTSEQLRLLLGGASGKGVLNYQGKTYPFTVKAVTVGGVGVTKVDSVGDVYFLNKLEDFPGIYSAASIGATVVKGGQGSQYQNDKGVFISVKSKTEGIGLSLGLAGVQVEFAK